jgi:predicted DNA-binding transcriptional regulator AlpA
MSLTLLTSKQVEARLGWSLGTLAVLRCRRSKNIPPHIQLGRSIRYRPEDIDAFLAANTVGGAK